MNTEPYETIEKDDCTIAIYQDECGESPREWDNLGTMVCWHNRYNLGDVQLGDRNFVKGKPYFYDIDDLNEFLKENKDKLIVLPLYLYDHSGITMSTSNRRYPFNDGWDSGCVGVIYVTYETIREEYGWKVITRARQEQIKEYLRNEVEVYDDYLTGNVYGYEVFCDNHDPEHEESIDSCWGFYGDNWKGNGLLAQAYTHCNRCQDEQESAYLHSMAMEE